LVNAFQIKFGIGVSGQLGYSDLVIPSVGTGYCLSVNKMTRLFSQCLLEKEKGF